VTRSQRLFSRWHLLLIPWLLFVAWWSGLLISFEYRLPWLAAISRPHWSPVLIAPFVAAVLGVACLSRRRRRDLLALVATYFLGVTLAWAWIRADDAAFARECDRAGAVALRARWWPYSNWTHFEYDDEGEIWLMD
jgi:hypothetical protein